MQINPEVSQELEALAYVNDFVMEKGIVLDVEFPLTHPLSQAIYQCLKDGENPMFKHPEFMDYSCTKANFDRVSEKLCELAKRREEYNRLQSEIKNVFDPTIDYSTPKEDRTLEQGLEATSESISGNAKGLCGSWKEFESVIGGLRAGMLIGIAGESESGKTTFAVNWFDQVMKANEGVKGLMISLEMDEAEFTKKVVQICSDLDQRHLVSSVQHGTKLSDFEYGSWNNCVFNYNANTLDKIRATIQKNRPHLVMIDHLQFMINKERGVSLAEWVNVACNGLKQFAKEFGCAIIILSQIDKEGSKSHMVNGEQKKIKPKLVNAWGGISFKASLDAGGMVFRDGNESLVYWDKVRTVWDSKYRYVDFKVDINGDVGKIYGLEVA